MTQQQEEACLESPIHSAIPAPMLSSSDISVLSDLTSDTRRTKSHGEEKSISSDTWHTASESNSQFAEQEYNRHVLLRELQKTRENSACFDTRQSSSNEQIRERRSSLNLSTNTAPTLALTEASEFHQRLDVSGRSSGADLYSTKTSRRVEQATNNIQILKLENAKLEHENSVLRIDAARHNNGNLLTNFREEYSLDDISTFWLITSLPLHVACLVIFFFK